MDFKKEFEKREIQYTDLLLFGDLTDKEKEQVIDLHNRLEGHLYDINYLVDFVRDIPSYVKFLDEDEVMALIGVALLDEFVYIAFDKDNNMKLYSGCIKYDILNKNEGKFIPDIPSLKEIKKQLCTEEGEQILVYKNFSK